MSRILVVGEDALCCALGEKLVAAALPDWRFAAPSIDAKGITKLVPNLPRYAEQAAHVQPVLCIADTDGRCALDLMAAWRPENARQHFILRLAVAEAESWVLADRPGFAEAFQVTMNKLPAILDDEPDPKRLLLTLMAKSRKRIFRDEIVSQTDRNKQGAGYNVHLGKFVRSSWNIRRACDHSPSLNRALRSLQSLDANKR
ncbi:hypothetical protein [Paraburkholderia caballeronis]|uniref:hypothetical protein n=1 Tax=Paraburkholderia caballeronis TaxID=416943 RepID=UPI00089B4A6E|nr:hypothetical protein [Paraburkholderia caballeronis]SEE12364.1 hypothetical protein SAMN05445871_4715 [Paraburkholderia caballeronis]